MALTARNFSRRPSQLLQIDDEVMALDFDLTCTTRLRFYDAELEQLRLEAMSVGTLGRTLGTQAQTRPFSGAPIGEITQANFRDQGF